MKSNFAKICLVTLSFTFTLPLVAKDKEKDSAMAVFPAEGRINLEQGTIEAWVSLDYSFDKNHLNQQSLVNPMTFLVFEKLQTKNNKKPKSNIRDVNIELITEQGKSLKNNIRFISSFGQKKVGNKILSSWVNFDMEDFKWKKGEWHFLAATWQKSGDDYVFKLQVDDKEGTATCPANQFQPKDLKDYIIYIGNFKSSQGAIETLRVSDKVRTEEEIKTSLTKGVEEDKSTLLFFDYKTVRKMKKQKSIKFLTQVRLNKKGTFVGSYKLIKGKFGKAVQFHK